jgi:hypothetical protein
MKIKISKKQWAKIGEESGWIKHRSQSNQRGDQRSDEYSDIASTPAMSLSHNTILYKMKEMLDKGDVHHPEFERLGRVYKNRFNQDVTIEMLEWIGKTKSTH